MPENNYSIKYTENARIQLQEFQKDQVKKLEELILSEKYVIGDEVVEITGSDILQAQKRIIFSKSKQGDFKKKFMYRTVSMAYIFLGLIMAIGGLSYEYFEEMIKTNREQFLFIAMGLVITAMGIFTLFYSRLREKRLEEIEKLNEKITNIKIENIYNE